MSTSLVSWKDLPNGPLTAVDDHLSMSISLDDLPDLPGAREPAMVEEPDPLRGQLLSWSEDAELREIHRSSDDPIVIELPQGEWRQPSEPLF